MTAAAIFHRYFPALYLFLMALTGCVLGWIASVALAIWLTPPVHLEMTAGPARAEVFQSTKLSDYQVILERNVFDSSAPTASLLAEESTEPKDTPRPVTPARAATVPRKNYSLIGTVVAGEDSLAVLSEGRETGVFLLHEELDDGSTVHEISRNSVTLKYSDGSTEVLVLQTDGATSTRKSAAAASRQARTATTGNSYNIQSVGENKWAIPRQTADNARSNLNELLRQARMEPRIIEGETSGFVVRMIRPNSFLDMLGIRRGDILMQINDIELNSPEKALQIFQQLREARSISVGLIRGGQPQTFEYEIK